MNQTEYHDRAAQSRPASRRMACTVPPACCDILLRWPQARRWALIFAATTLACLWSPAVRAQLPMVLQQTTTGCGVYGFPGLAKFNPVYTWSGDCVDGLVHGAGVLQTKWAPTNSVITSEEKSMFHRGKRFGFGHNKTRWEGGSTEAWNFFYDDKAVIFGGLGLQGDASLLSNASDAMPRRAIALTNQAFIGVFDKLIYSEASCLIDPARFDGCGMGEGKQDFKVYNLYRIAGADTKRTYCPNPRDKASCEGLAATLSAPYVAEAETFIRANMPAVQAMMTAMHDAKVESERQRARAVVDKAAAEQEAARQQAAANASFERRLDTAPVGELLSMADEMLSNGDRARARLALRKLMGRFPDHKLAGTAATMLTELQGK